MFPYDSPFTNNDKVDISTYPAIPIQNKVLATEYNALTSGVNALADALGIRNLNRGMTALVTTGDGQLACSTPIALAIVPGWVTVAINGLVVTSSSGTKDKDCYFSKDGGTTSTAYDALTSADYLYWNGSISGFQLDSVDKIDFIY